ncbi:isochorismatase family cysteine hydrolase [Granulosicoccaceae sp. 1_MG-2023]|nr:isochorismatase family cysteine hydrolase [Granulosicoccaceae sp. 1_MG-2023]
MTDWLLILSFVLATYLVGLLYLHVRPVRGRKLQRQALNRRALLVLDMQEEFCAGHGYDKAQMDGLCERIHVLQDRFAEQGDQVVQLRHYYSSRAMRLLVRLFAGGVGLHNSAVDPRLSRDAIPVYSHRRSDAFSNRRLARFLDEQQVGEVVLCGIDTVFNLRLTAISAQERGYRVIVIEDAATTRMPAKWPLMRDKLVKRGIRIERSSDLTAAD